MCLFVWFVSFVFVFILFNSNNNINRFCIYIFFSSSLCFFLLFVVFALLIHHFKI